jgi:hypothetical protein
MGKNKFIRMEKFKRIKTKKNGELLIHNKLPLKEAARFVVFSEKKKELIKIAKKSDFTLTNTSW